MNDAGHATDVAKERAAAIAMAGMVERVARAIATAKWKLDGVDGFNPDDAYDLTNNNGRWVFDEMARAAIAAMKAPSQPMQQAVAAQWGRRTWSQYEEVIDAALADNAKSDDFL